jgi:anaerobic dimethyl sulfoxide reductase subunit B (iron-sulfur subunit)
LVSQYAFFVNSDACSGCKTCQVSCNDKNNIPAGIHWRRVYEITGGSWEKKGNAWVSSVVAYNLSMSCVHCFAPVCLDSCPSQVIWKRDDGIVLIDESRCSRCRRCESACPYGAVRYDAVTDMLLKCDFCMDYLDAGLPPACVAACPNRALDFGDYNDLKIKYGNVGRVFPLPDPFVASPALIIKPHRNAALVQSRDPEVANWAEL